MWHPDYYEQNPSVYKTKTLKYTHKNKICNQKLSKI